MGARGKDGKGTRGNSDGILAMSRTSHNKPEIPEVTQTLQAGSTRTIALFSGGEHVPRASLPVRQHPAAVAERILHIEVGRSAEPSVDWFAHLGHSD